MARKKLIMKKCSCCGKEKEDSRKYFYFVHIVDQKLDAICISCKSKIAAERYLKNKNKPKIKEEKSFVNIKKTIELIKSKEKINIQQGIFYALHEFDISISYPTFIKAVRETEIGYILSGTRKFVVIREKLEDWLNGEN